MKRKDKALPHGKRKSTPNTQNQPSISDAKAALDAALGKQGVSYWRLIVDYLEGALSKCEFDHFMARILPPQHVALHNSFILALYETTAAQDQSGSRECPLDDDPIEMLEDATPVPSVKTGGFSFSQYERNLMRNNLRRHLAALEHGVGIQECEAEIIVETLKRTNQLSFSFSLSRDLVTVKEIADRLRHFCRALGLQSNIRASEVLDSCVMDLFFAYHSYLKNLIEAAVSFPDQPSSSGKIFLTEKSLIAATVEFPNIFISDTAVMDVLNGT